MSESTREMLAGNVAYVVGQLQGGHLTDMIEQWHESEGHTWDEAEEVWRDEDGDEVSDPEEYELEDSPVVSYLDGVLDVEYIIGADGSYRGSVVTVATGGPHIEIDTRRNVVIGYWSSETVTQSFLDTLGLDECLEEDCRNIAGL